MVLAGQGSVAAPGRHGPQGHPLIQLHVPADDGGLAHHDAGAVVDEEVGADGGPGVDVDTGAAVGIFGHDPGDHGHPLAVQQVGDAVNEDGEQPRIGEDDLLPGGGGGVGLKGGVQVLQQQLLHLGQAAGKFPGDLLRPAHLVLRQGQLQLLGELFTDALQQQGGVILRGQGHQRRVPEIGGKQQAADLLHQLDDRPAVRQAQAAAIQGGVALRQGAAYGRGGFLDVLGIHKQASFPCVEKTKRQRMRHTSSAAAFTRFSRARQARAFWANHA